ncbi:MAG: hypothetical protein ABR567_13390 [Myxococcales bacterium]|nr:hypothetical protein [Myxococcales bacterium]
MTAAARQHESEESRGCLGTVYRVTADFLVERKLLDEVKAKLSPASRRMLEKLPFPFAWQDAAALEEIERLLYAKSPQLATDLGFAAAKYLSGSVVAPVLKMATSLFGRTPDAFFRNLDRFFSMVVRGFDFRYEADGEKRGKVIARIHGGPVHPSLFQQLKGNLGMLFPLSGATGSVEEPLVLRSDDAGAEVVLGVRWE